MIILQDTLSVLVGLAAGAACAASMLAARRRVLIPALFIQFVCASLLFSSLPTALVVAYCIVGACVCGILAVTPGGTNPSGGPRQAGIPSGTWFRLVALMLVGLASVPFARAALGGDALAPGVPMGTGLLMGLGLLQVGLSEDALRVGSGLMSIIGGFEIGYSTVETSIALHGLIIGVPLLIAIIVSYLRVQAPEGSEAVS